MKKYLLILPILILIVSLVFITFNSFQNQKENNRPLQISLPHFLEGKVSIVTEATIDNANWNTFEDKASGISFKYPQGFTVNNSFNASCASLLESTCFKINYNENYILLKLDHTGNKFKSGTGELNYNDIVEGKVIVLDNEVLLFRKNKPNGLFNYDERINIELSFIKSFHSDIDYTYSSPTAGKISTWLTNDQTGYTITYLINDNNLNINNLNDSKIVSTFDQIISTLEIDFDKSPFN